MLAGKRLLVTGVVTGDSIAFEVARQAQAAGAEILLTGFGRTRRMTERAARQLARPVEVLELDVNRAQDLTALAAELDDRWGVVDGLLHAIAFAPADALGGSFLSAPTQSALAAFHTSAVSLRDLTVGLLPLLERAEEGGSVVGLDFDASVAWPAYDWMGVAKAGLEAISRYLARDLGPRGVRVNLVSAGPIETIAAGGIQGFEKLAANWQATAPLGWEAGDPSSIAGTACYLFSTLSRGVTGEIIHVDGGYHAMGSQLS